MAQLRPDTTAQAKPFYSVNLPCPVCGLQGTHRVLRAKAVLSLEIPGHPFLRAFTWSQEQPRPQNSPFFFGLCCCPTCRYVGVDGEFRPEESLVHPNARSVRKVFINERAGRQGAVFALLGKDPEMLPEPERSIRLNLAAIRAEMLVYPELWRRAELGRLYLRLAWFYLDEAHLDWQGVRPAAPPVYLESGPNAERLRRVLASLESLRSEWPEIPLEEECCRQEALRFHHEVFQSRRDLPDPVQAVTEERQLAQLFGLVGQLDTARELLDRALQLCGRSRLEEFARQQSSWKDSTITMAQRRAMTVRIQRLALLAEEIAAERRDIFGAPASPPKPARVEPVPRTSSRPAPARATAEPKKRFGFFR